MNAVFFESHLLAIAIEQIHVIVIAFVHLWYKQNSSRKSNQSHRQLTDSHEIIYSVKIDPKRRGFRTVFSLLLRSN